MMHKPIRILTVTLLLLLVVMLMPACAKKSRYIVATTPNYPPLVMITEEKEITGFDIDVIDKIAQLSSMEIKIIPVLEGNLLHGLIDETYDIAVAAIVSPQKTHSPERIDIGYSKPYLEIGDVLVISEDMRDFSGLEDLTGKRVGVPIPSESKRVFIERGNIEVKEYMEIDDALEEMALGKVDAVSLDLLSAAQRVMLNEEYRRIFRIHPKAVTKKEYVIAVKRENSALLNKVNSALDKMKRDGSLDTLTIKWFFSE